MDKRELNLRNNRGIIYDDAWNPSTIYQKVSRGIRACSHQELIEQRLKALPEVYIKLINLFIDNGYKIIKERDVRILFRSFVFLIIPIFNPNTHLRILDFTIMEIPLELYIKEKFKTITIDESQLYASEFVYSNINRENIIPKLLPSSYKRSMNILCATPIITKVFELSYYIELLKKVREDENLSYITFGDENTKIP
jgi:hypothetical protein